MIQLKKIQPIYFYFTAIIIILVSIFIISKNYNSKSKEPSSVATPSGDISGKQMPQDAIHKGLQNPIAQPPTKDNVLPEIRKHMESLKKAVEEHPRDTLKIREYAEFLAEANMNDQAIDYYKKILKINPRRTDVLSSLVYLYYAKSDLNSAEECLNKILSIDRNNVDAIYNLGAISANKGDLAKAKELWTRIVTKYPASSLAQKAKESLSKL